ncbi:hypothetical protein [Paenibacillus jiagnxiensis]|uniref:hypothetical protein n=1 Tax=Paenibacillus jiagnxiensis TaxID=3228926 RepID=UPI0033BD8DBB
MKLQVSNCPKCGSVYQNNLRELCPACSAQMDRQLDLCFEYLWHHPAATVEEVSEAAGVSLPLMTAWVKNGKFPSVYKNLSYPCESCRQPVHTGRLCPSCSGMFSEAARQIEARLPRRFQSGTYKVAGHARI